MVIFLGEARKITIEGDLHDFRHRLFPVLMCSASRLYMCIRDHIWQSQESLGRLMRAHEIRGDGPSCWAARQNSGCKVEHLGACREPIVGLFRHSENMLGSDSMSKSHKLAISMMDAVKAAPDKKAGVLTDFDTLKQYGKNIDRFCSWASE